MQISLDKQGPQIKPAAQSKEASPSTATFCPQLREENVLRKTGGSLARWERAKLSLAGGVSSALRRMARPHPLYFSGGSGPRLTDVDGNAYLDYTLGWGPNILGNAPQEVTAAISASISNGLTFGAQHELEYEVAELLTDILPCADKVCFACSGTEIIQTALRLARSVTGRKLVLKFEGHYHGWDDSILVSYHPTQEQIAATDGPIVDGLGQIVPQHVVVAQWNCVAEVEAAFAKHRGEISAIICEPLLANSGCINAQPGFLQFLREITLREGALLIFDEVITGFRLALDGAQGFYGITPDLATYAKAVGAGTPLSVLAGKQEYMELIATGKSLHVGTLNGNPMVLAAAKAALQLLQKDHLTTYADLHRRGQELRAGLQEVLTSAGIPVVTTGEGPCFSLHFTERQPQNYRDLFDVNRALYSDFALAMLDEGVLVLPDARWYISTAHTDRDIAATIAAARRAIG